jgi:subtilisin family serine protease
LPNEILGDLHENLTSVDFAGGGATLTCQNALAQTNSLESIARQRIAQRYNLPTERLTMIYSTTATYRLSNQTAYAFKALDNEAATLYTLTLDRNGEEVDADHLLAAERAAYRALYGKMEPELSEWVQRASASERKSVMIWVKEPPGLPRITPPMPHSGVSQEAVDRYFAQVRSLRESQVASVVCPIADRCRERGLSVRYGRFVPVLYGDFSASEVRQVERWEEVESIGIVREGELFMDTARQTVRANVVEARGFRGEGVEVGLVEVPSQGGTRVALNNPYLDGVQEANTNCTQVSTHATKVAGVIRSTHPTVRGIAPDVKLWSGVACDGNNFGEVMQLSEQAIDWGAKVINMSWGVVSSIYLCTVSPTPLLPIDRFYDTLVFKNRVSFAVAVGNSGQNIDENDNPVCGHDLPEPGNADQSVASPSRGYNVIGVGGFDDKDTADWSDDCLYTQSSWCGPPSLHNDRTKPEVVAPAASIASTLPQLLNNEWVGCAVGNCLVIRHACGCRFINNDPTCQYTYYGTSFASPIVTGMIALMIQRSRTLNSALEAWPEAIKAILMATAVHNISGDTRLSKCDGAGGVDAVSADDVVRGVNGSWGAKEYDCSNPSPDDVATISLVAGQRVRVVIVWPTDPSFPDDIEFASRPTADLDLLIVNPLGSIAAQSVSHDNTYEIVDFVVPANGVYKIRVVRNHCEVNYPPNYLAWAWWIGSAQ